MVVGVGVDLFEIARMTRELRGRDPGLREELFTPAEIACCEAARDPMACYAERFAAKEAVFKALAPSGGGASWHDVEVRPRGRRGDVFLHGTMKAHGRGPGRSAAPALAVAPPRAGDAERRAARIIREAMRCSERMTRSGGSTSPG